MITIKADLSSSFDSLEIHTFADLHIGDKECDLKTIYDRVNRVKETPNAYVILNGDIINNATKTAISDCYAEELSPMEELERYSSLFEPIKDKILAILQGNHERRTYNKEGVDLSHVVAKQLGISNKYSNGSAVIFVRFGEELKHHRKMCYSIYCNHGSGGGRKEGAKANRLADMACIVDADIYIHSHTHLPMIMKQAFYRTSYSNSSVALVDKLFVNTSACLNYGGYGEHSEFKPSSKDTPIIYLDGHRKGMTAKL